MPIHVSWANEQQTIIHTIYDGVWTLSDFHATVDTMYDLATSVDHTVHFILDFRASNSSPAKFFSAGRHVENKKAPNTGISVIVGANSFLNAMLRMAEKLFLRDFSIHPADTLEEAEEIIRKYEQDAISKR